MYHALQANCKTLSVLEWYYLVPEDEEEEKIFKKAVCHHRGPIPQKNLLHPSLSKQPHVVVHNTGIMFYKVVGFPAFVRRILVLLVLGILAGSLQIHLETRCWKQLCMWFRQPMVLCARFFGALRSLLDRATE